MKKLLKLGVALALVLTVVLAIAALADVQYTGPLPLYVNKEKIKVYKEQDKESRVLNKLKGATAVVPELVSDNGKWYGIMVEDTKHGGQRIGWVVARYLVDYLPQSLCQHDWSKWTVEREATCTQKGYRTRTCKICGLLDEQETKKLEHDWGKWKITEEATCTEEGERTRTCKECGKKETEEYLEDHEFGTWTMTKEPTCTAKGERAHTCKVCGTVQKQELEMLAHDYEYTVTVEPTDHSAGVRAKICKMCGKNGGEETFDPEGTLRRKDRGEAVRAIQQLLVEQGYLNAGGADGVFGGGTEKALMQYQQDRGLNPDGVAWPQTIDDLQHDFGPWEVVKEMTRSEAGERRRVCQGCGFEQHETIESGEVFEHNRRGEDVRALQQMLTSLGFNAGSFDGIYGKKLDAALAGFAEANGIIVESGVVRPSDIDAVLNAWLDAGNPEDWKGEGSEDSPVNLALNVTRTDDANNDTGIHTYSWSLTNLGSEKTTYVALLLTFGNYPDFKKNNLVMNLDGVVMKPNAGNEITGSFSVSDDWGDGNINFAALSVSDDTGVKWLSNMVVFEKEDASAPKTVVPEAAEIDVNNLDDGTYYVSFDRGDVLSGATGTYMNQVHIFSRDWYDMLDVINLKAGDTIIVEGEEVPVLSVEETEYGYLVNDGQDARSFYLAGEDDNNGFGVRGLDDLTTFTERGVTTLVIDPSATYTDSSDIESEPVTVSYDGIVNAMQSSAIDYFVPYNTTVRVEGGKVVEINRTYVP